LKTFDELDLIAPLRRALVDQNYTIPTAIQAKTIPHALENRDVLGCAQTGTGKTAAFALPILDYLGGEKRRAIPNCPIALVLAPTRELAIQIGESFKTYGRHLKLQTVLVYGGVNQGNQVRALDRGAHVVVATPGRLLDLMNQGYIQLDQLEIFVLDEADRMLDMGFLPDLKRIIRELPRERQSLFFSATMAPKISELASSLLFNPVSVNVTPKSPSVKQIEQQLIFVQRNGKQQLLEKILRGEDVERAIVFTRTKRGANTVARRLDEAGIQSAVIHGNKSQNSRQRALDSFRRNRVRVLVATDVAARGIDIDGITHVINFDLPAGEPEAYVHRIGRTGRAGAQGIAISLCTSAELDELRAIEQLIGIKIPRDPNQPMPRAEHNDSANPSRGRNGQSRGGNRPAGGIGKKRRPASGRRRQSSGGSADAAKGGSDLRNRSSSERPASNQRPANQKQTAKRLATTKKSSQVSRVTVAATGAGNERNRKRKNRPAH
jgi:ATP-dependent RNA helicase RhlE